MKRNSEETLYKIDYLTIMLIVGNILWAGLIFWFSSHPGNESSQISGIFANVLINVSNFIFKGSVPRIVEKLLFNGHFIRKCGHVGEYFILGILVFSLIKKLEVKKSAVVASFICFFYAITDELHQIFVPGRGPAVSDVLLDFVSSIAGILIANLLFFRKKVKK